MFQKGNLVTPTSTEGPPLFADKEARQGFRLEGSRSYGKEGETFICEGEGNISGRPYHIMRRLVDGAYAFRRASDTYEDHRWRAL